MSVTSSMLEITLADNEDKYHKVKALKIDVQKTKSRREELSEQKVEPPLNNAI